jgi:hypothetical protein
LLLAFSICLLLPLHPQLPTLRCHLLSVAHRRHRL